MVFGLPCFKNLKCFIKVDIKTEPILVRDTCTQTNSRRTRYICDNVKTSNVSLLFVGISFTFLHFRCVCRLDIKSSPWLSEMLVKRHT